MQGFRNAQALCLLAFFSMLPAVSSGAAPESVKSCFDCHGDQGVSLEKDVPTIAGFSALYFADTMAAYAAKDRPCPESEYPAGPNKGKKTDMCKLAQDLSESEINEMAEYFAGKPFVPAKQEFDAALAAKGKKVHEELCEKCHSDGGSLASDDASILAGQWQHYQREALKAYMSGAREAEKKMAQKIEKLDDAMVEQLVHYYSSLQ